MENTGPDTEETDEDRVMHIRFGRGNDRRVEETLRAIDRGESPEPYYERVYRDPEHLHRVTRPKNLELLETIVREKPESIRDTARLVDRDVRQVHRNLEELEELGLLSFESDGQAKRPTVWYDQIDVELPLDRPPESDQAEA